MSTGIGIYIGRKQVVAAQVVRAAKSVVLKKYAVENIAVTDSEIITENGAKSTAESVAVQQVLQKLGIKKTFASVAISPFHVVTRHFIMPVLPKKEKPEAIKFEASRCTRLKINEANFSYCENAVVNKASSVTVNAVRKRKLQSLIMNLRRGGVDPTVIEPDYVAYSRICQYFGFSDFQQPHALLWFDGDQSVNLTLISNRIVFFGQDFRLSGEWEHDLHKLHDELMGSFRYLSENTGGAHVQTIFIAGFGKIDEFAQFIQNSFKDASVNVLRPPVEEEDPNGASAAVLAMGLALGETMWKAPIGNVSLLPFEEKKLRPAVMAALIGGVIAAVAIFFMMVHFLIFSPMLRNLENKNQQAQQPLASFGADANNSLAELQERAARLEAKYANLAVFDKQAYPLKGVFISVVKAMPKSFWLQSISLKNSEKSMVLSLQGYCFLGEADKEAKQINAWAQDLAQNPVFSKKFPHLAVDEIKQEKFMGRGMTHFNITAEE